MVRCYVPPLVAALDLTGDVLPGWRVETKSGGLRPQKTGAANFVIKKINDQEPLSWKNAKLLMGWRKKDKKDFVQGGHLENTDHNLLRIVSSCE